MQTDASPCSGHVRLRKTFDGTPVRQTSAGHGAWHTGQRDVVRLSNSSVRENFGVARFMTSSTDPDPPTTGGGATEETADQAKAGEDERKSQGQGHAQTGF